MISIRPLSENPPGAARSSEFYKNTATVETVALVLHVAPPGVK